MSNTDNREAILAIQRVQDYIEEHIGEPITLSQLAKAAGYSQWHTARLFKQYAGNTPFDYIRMLRLSKAALLLRDGRPKVVDVAFDFVFDTHEGFTRAFSKQFGVSPKAYSMKPSPIPLFLPSGVRGYHLDYKKGVNKMPNDEKKDSFLHRLWNAPREKSCSNGQQRQPIISLTVKKSAAMSGAY